MNLTKEKAIAALQKVEDPELQIDVWTLGLIYDVSINDSSVSVKMTLTSPVCPYAPMLMSQIQQCLEKAGFKEVKLDLVFDPPWQPSEDVRAMLGMTF